MSSQGSARSLIGDGPRGAISTWPSRKYSKLPGSRYPTSVDLPGQLEQPGQRSVWSLRCST